ncbi:MAG TPA: KpsF/GutQ family sugar-phosphate isomerase [Caulobacteraceae bacterium]|nr:KpsF/GutQ family sugar-phosphate isomerase [Caulobacteraceae bacterium]
MTPPPKIVREVDPSASAVRAVEAEIEGLHALVEALRRGLSKSLGEAVETITAARGRVVVTGMGKSGHVARKIAATLASTGTPAFFLHPAEASHGDLGMVADGDVLLALSLSGETPELRDVIGYAKRFAVPLIAMTSERGSALARAADIALVLPRAEEACPIGLAPTTSTTMQMAFGDALAIALLEGRGFSASRFREFHPGGRLGARLVTVGDLMLKGSDLPTLPEVATLSEAIFELTRGRCGGAAVVDDDGRLVGAFTDGDLRRAMGRAEISARVFEHMSRTPVWVEPTLLAAEALRLMNDGPKPIMLVFVCENDRLVGAVHMHDLLRAGVA